MKENILSSIIIKREEHFPSGFFFKPSFHSGEEKSLGESVLPSAGKFCPWQKVKPM